MKARRWQAAMLAGALASVGLGACGGGEANARTIEVDYRSDDFAGSFFAYYPREVTVRPGMTLKFHQTWTGEPHSVTFGTIVDQNAAKYRDLLRGIAKGEPTTGPPEDYDFALWEDRLPTLFDQKIQDGLAQDAAFPCFVEKEADLPLDNERCSAAQRRQPEFTGRHAYYSSGFIPFEGPRGNTFEMKIADDAKEGTYLYYCNVHGLPQSGEITIKRGAEVESQASMNRRGREESKVISAPVLKALEKERAGKGEYPLPLAGSGDESVEGVFGIANEFTPRTINARVGEKVTWTFIGNHTISFNVPPYAPLFRFRSGKLVFNKDLDKAAGGWPGAPDRPESRGPGESDAPPVSIDAGEWDGSGGLHSSGTNWDTGDKYSVTFTKAGTYPYACLIHPGQIGKVVVK